IPDAEPAGIGRWDLNPAAWVRLACHVANRELSRSDWRQMSAPSPTTDLSIGARLTGYLRERFTWRTSTEARPRYLGIFAVPTPDYMGAAAAPERFRALGSRLDRRSSSATFQ